MITELTPTKLLHVMMVSLSDLFNDACNTAALNAAELHDSLLEQVSTVRTGEH